MTEPNLVAAGVIVLLLVGILFWVILEARVEAIGCTIITAVVSVYGLNQTWTSGRTLNDFAGWTFIGVPILLIIGLLGLVIQRQRSRRR